MKKRLLLIACLLLIAAPVFGADYYACQNAQNINGDATWCTSAHRTGSCAGDGTYTSWATVTSSDNLHANGCATITIPVDVTITVAKITNKTDGTGTDGGQFKFTTSTGHPSTLIANIEAGGTTGAPLLLTGSGTGTVFTIGSAGSPVTITGGSAASIYGVSAAQTNGNVVLYGNITGGSNSSAHGYRHSNTGTLTMTGNATGATAAGISNSGTGAITITGNCTGGTTGADSVGCHAVNSGVITIVGSIINGSRAMGAAGAIVWDPGTLGTNFRYFSITGDGTPATVYAVVPPAAADVKSGTEYGWDGADHYTGTYSAGGGGGAWGF